MNPNQYDPSYVHDVKIMNKSSDTLLDRVNELETILSSFAVMGKLILEGKRVPIEHDLLRQHCVDAYKVLYHQ